MFIVHTHMHMHMHMHMHIYSLLLGDINCIDQTLLLLFEYLMTGQWSKFEWLHHDVFEPKLLWNNGVVLLTESWLITSILWYVFYCLYVSKCHLDVLISKIMIPSKCT